jgi:hypothetical protein
MSADSSMGANTSNIIDATSQNDINDAAWNPVGDSPLIAPVSATTEVPPIEEVKQVEAAEPVAPVVELEELEAPDETPSAQEVLSTSNLRVEIPESSDSDDDMPPLISSSEEEDSYDSKESEDDSKESENDSKDDSESDSKEESDDSKEESEDDSKESEEDLMVAVFQRPTCPRCDAALMALLTPSEESDESSTESSSDSGSPRAHRIRPKPTEIPTIILTLFKILLFLHIVQLLTTTIAPARRTY